ncbi:ferredoxin [Amycolatopsis marina]|uniref:Ferredoxin n=1 Tax=Amycolatopsis marina TaxID=490629 RepID=A0A1I0WL30_9PSEU|nr:ferredoxin [Amycolatopsis marina]SFA88713.1 ferredoxin [Amycolatopsis marina]
MFLSPLRVQVDFDRCEGHGLCTGAAPEIFELDDSGKLHVLQEIVPVGQELHAKEAVRVCPVVALRTTTSP